MKKKIGCLLLATMILSLVGCGEKTNQYGTVKLGKYKGLEETRYVNQITDNDIQCEIDRLMEENPELVAVERKIKNSKIDKECQILDYVDVDEKNHQQNYAHIKILEIRENNTYTRRYPQCPQKISTT